LAFYFHEVSDLSDCITNSFYYLYPTVTYCSREELPGCHAMSMKLLQRKIRNSQNVF
jgi:hypothetical protein